MRVLVTGGAGFVGSHLCDALLAEGNYVVCVDNLLTGSLRNLEHLKNESRFEFVQQDVNEPLTGPRGLRFSFRVAGSPVDYMEHGIDTLKVGSLGTFHALELAQKYGAKYHVCLDLRMLWRSAGASAERDLLGTRESRSGRARCMTKPSDSPKPPPWLTIATTRWTRASCASSIPTGRACN